MKTKNTAEDRRRQEMIISALLLSCCYVGKIMFPESVSA